MNFLQFYNTIISKNSHEKGQIFEKSIKNYLKKSSQYRGQIKNVYLWNEWKYAQSHDIGIDLIAEGFGENEFWAVQCKCFNKDTTTLSKGDIDSFLSASSKSFSYNDITIKFKQRLLIATVENIGKNADNSLKEQNPPCRSIFFQELIEDNSVSWTASGEIKQQKGRKKSLRPYQKKAVEQIEEKFNHAEEPADRGQMIMACGTGKTFTSLKVAESLKARRILYIVPSLSLLAQTMQDWNENGNERQIHLVVSSDRSIKTDKLQEDSTDQFLSGMPSTTNVDDIKDFLSRSWEHPMVIFSTYKSLDKVAEVQKDPNIPDFDLTLCDEAHRCAGLEGAESTLILDDKSIRTKKRLFLTATPKIYSSSLKKKGKIKNKLICSMDDEEKFGKTLFHYGFTQAIEEGNLCDYKVIIFKISVDRTHKEIGDILDHSKHIMEPLWNLMRTKKLSRSLVFMNKISESKAFQKLFHQDKHELSVEHIDGNMGGLTKRKKLNWLKEESKNKNEIRMLSNVKCLSEGVDVPQIDACFFGKPRKSSIDIVQSVGRAIRKAKDKSHGYIILPALIPKDRSEQQTLKESGYALIWQVLVALRCHDESLDLEINKMRFSGKEPSSVKEESPKYESEDPKITVWDGDLGKEVSIEAGKHLQPQMRLFYQNIHAQIVENLGDKNYFEKWILSVSDLGDQLQTQMNKEYRINKPFQNKLRDLRESLKKNVNQNITHQNCILMLTQHLLTEPIFDALFPKESTIRGKTPLFQSLEEVLSLLSQNKETLRTSLKNFYTSVENKAKNITEEEDRQEFLNTLYKNFFMGFDRKKFDRDGIVYTPQSLVKFMIRMTDQIMQKEFGYGLEKENVNILDPFTGTGNFIINLLKFFKEKGFNEDIKRKYRQELHCNEISLLPYYIASYNIEHTYNLLNNIEESFLGICLVDTFSLTKNSQATFEFLKDKNIERIERQKNLPIQVFLTNPPYSKGQKNENDNNKAIKHEELEQRIQQTYIHECLDKKSTKLALYNSYIKAFRFASDRLGERGVIAYITNNQFLTTNSFSGFRISLEKEFHSVYHFDLKGNARHISRENKKKQGGNVFNIMTGVGITFLVKKPIEEKKKGIFLFRVKDYTKGIDKMNELKNLPHLDAIPFQKIEPKKGVWINHGREEWENFIPLRCSNKHNSDGLFILANTGTKSNRDQWIYDFNTTSLQKKVQRLIKTYTDDLNKARHKEYKDKKIEDIITTNHHLIKWDSTLKKTFKKDQEIQYNEKHMRTSYTSAFCKQYIYYQDELINSKNQGFEAFPQDTTENISIAFTDKGKGDFSCFVFDQLLNLSALALTRHVPLHRYKEGEKLDNLTDWGLKIFQDFYRKAEIRKKQIFSYVYGILNSPEYRTLYENDLFKENAKVPLFTKYDDFIKCSSLGQKLIDLHINYEEIPAYQDVEIEKSNLFEIPSEELYRVNKMKFSKDKQTLYYNEYITIHNIPQRAFQWEINGHGAIEEIVRAYQQKTLKDTQFLKDPNTYKNPKYIYDLVLSVLNLSVQTAELCDQIPKIEGKIKTQ